ncbi:MAG: STAS domain-containing protein [Actinomycetota bacterium]|nr:STAS domain-containing protein [Actinomycetota bacterium]
MLLSLDPIGPPGVYRLVGVIDSSNAEQLDLIMNALEVERREGASVTLDLSEAEFIGSAGFAVLLSRARSTKASTLTLSDPRADDRRVLEILFPVGSQGVTIRVSEDESVTTEPGERSRSQQRSR